MKNNGKIAYALLASLFFVGLGISMSWAYYTSRLLGLFLMIVSTLGLYVLYKKLNKTIVVKQKIKLRYLALGISLIFIDVLYNLLFSNKFGPFDIGIILAGISIFVINTIGIKLFALEDKIVKFSTYFIFITIVTYSALYTGMEKLFGAGDSNIFYNLFTSFATNIVSPILDIIYPTTVSNNTINFNGFSVEVGYGCSGVESLAVFFSAVSAFYFTQTKKDLKKFAKYVLLGGIALYSMNIIRIISIILIGYYFGLKWMMFFHAHLGWLMFVFGMLVFNYFVIDDFKL